MQREEIPEIPAEAIREAIANALCHRDYSSKTCVEINIYRNTVEITNPGLFPTGDSPEKHLTGNAEEFELRNPKIAQALFRAGIIEQYGSGIPRIKKACEAAGVSFKYRQGVTSTTISFNRPGSQLSVEKTPGNDHLVCPEANISAEALTHLNNREKKAIAIATKRGKVTTRDLVESESISRKTASTTLKELSKQGFLLWVGKNDRDLYQYYRLPDSK